MSTFAALLCRSELFAGTKSGLLCTLRNKETEYDQVKRKRVSCTLDIQP